MVLPVDCRVLKVNLSREHELNTMTNTEYKWYAIQTLTSQEKRVKESVLKAYKDNELVKDVLVPEIGVVEMKQGERVYRKQKLMPGYVLIHMAYEKTLFQEIRRLNGVVNFLGASHPQPLSEQDIKDIFEKTESTMIIIKKSAGTCPWLHR